MDTFYNFYNKRSKEELIEILRTMFRIQNEVEDYIAEMLGYAKGDGGPNDPSQGGYLIGDHTVLSLLDELKDRSKVYKKTNCPGPPHSGHASSDWSCPLD